MRILVTGAAGFIGGHLCSKLRKEGHEVVPVDNFFHPSLAKTPGVRYCDVRDRKSVFDFAESVDLVCHLAAQIHTDYSTLHPQETLDINILGTLNVLEACRTLDRPMIFQSTSEVYGTAVHEAIDEQHPTNPPHVYGVSKLAADRLCGSYYATYGLKVSILRCFNCYGPWQKSDSYGGVISIFVRQALAGEPITVFGDGRQSRDYVFVDDFLRAYDVAMKGGIAGKPMNFGTGVDFSILEIAQAVKKITGSSSPIVHLPSRIPEVQKLRADITLAARFGYAPTVTLEEGLRRFIDWYVAEGPGSKTRA